MNTSAFSDRIADLHLLRHPFYQDWMAGKLSRDVLKQYASQYYVHVAAFPRYLSSIHSMATSTPERLLLLQNLNDEEGVGFDASHPELWLRFAEGIGASRAEVQHQTPAPAIARVCATFFKYARSSYHEGVGALYAYESQIPEIAESKIQGLREKYGVTAAETLQFFEVHRVADVGHREVLQKILDDLPPVEKAEALQACRDTALALWDFLTSVHQVDPVAVA